MCATTFAGTFYYGPSSLMSIIAQVGRFIPFHKGYPLTTTVSGSTAFYETDIRYLFISKA